MPQLFFNVSLKFSSLFSLWIHARSRRQLLQIINGQKDLARCTRRLPKYERSTGHGENGRHSQLHQEIAWGVFLDWSPRFKHCQQIRERRRDAGGEDLLEPWRTKRRKQGKLCSLLR